MQDQRQKSLKILSILAIIAGFICVLPSCYTVPKGSDGRWFSCFPEDQNGYLKVNIDQNRGTVKAVVESVFANPQMYVTLLPNLAAIYSANDSKGTHMIILGRFPADIVRNELKKNKDFSVSEKNKHIFLSKASTQQIAVPVDGLILVSDGNIDDMLFRYESGIELSVLLEEDLSAWKAYAASAVGKEGFSLFEGGEGAFVTTVFIVEKQKKEYFVTVKIKCRNEAGIKPAKSLLKLFAGSATAKYNLSGDMPISEFIQIKTEALNVELLKLKFPQNIFPLWVSEIIGVGRIK